MEFEGFNELVKSIKRYISGGVTRGIFNKKVYILVAQDEKSYGFKDMFYWTFKKIMDEFDGDELDIICETWVTIMKSLWLEDSSKAVVESKRKDISLIQTGLSEFGEDGVRVGVCYSYAFMRYGKFSNSEDDASFRNEVCDTITRSTAGMNRFPRLFNDRKVSDMLSEASVLNYMKGFSKFLNWWDSRETGNTSLEKAVACDVFTDFENFDLYTYLNSSLEYIQDDEDKIMYWTEVITSVFSVSYDSDRKSYMYWKLREAISKMLVGAEYPDQTFNGCEILKIMLALYFNRSLVNYKMFNLKTLAMKARKGVIRNVDYLPDELILSLDDGLMACGL